MAHDRNHRSTNAPLPPSRHRSNGARPRSMSERRVCRPLERASSLPNERPAEQHDRYVCACVRVRVMFSSRRSAAVRARPPGGDLQVFGPGYRQDQYGSTRLIPNALTCLERDLNNPFAVYVVMEAYYGEILTTCEKLRWIIANGASALQTETRNPPLLLFLKHARVEYHPLGVIGIIIPWVRCKSAPSLAPVRAVSLMRMSGTELSLPQRDQWSCSGHLCWQRRSRQGVRVCQPLASLLS